MGPKDSSGTKDKDSDGDANTFEHTETIVDAENPLTFVVTIPAANVLDHASIDGTDILDSDDTTNDPKDVLI